MTFIRVFDFETTHETPDAGGGICEIGYCDLTVVRRDLLGAPTGFEIGEPRSILTHPGCPIPPVTSAIHHIIDDDVRDAPPWRAEFARVLTECGVPDCIGWGAHSAKFERLWMDALKDDRPAMPAMLCTYKLGLRVWPDAPSHSNQALRYHRKPEGLVRETAMPAHRAGPDAYVTAHHLRDILEEAAQRSAADLIGRAAKISEQPALQVTCHIGNWRGKKWAEVDDGFLDWILGKDFDEDVVFTVRHEIERRRLAEEEEARKKREGNG